MITIKRLYLVAGFDDGDVERQAAELQRGYVAGSYRFVARPYPGKVEKRAAYLQALVQSANDLIFGSGTATNFCRKQDQPCALEAAKGKAGGKTCERAKPEATACARSRPQLVVVICADQLFDQVLAKLGRGTLILRLEGPKLPPIDVLKNAIDGFEPIATAVVSTVSNRSKSVYAPLIPYLNFQCLGGHPIAADVQANQARFATILDGYHAKLYRANFTNPKKSSIRGGYMLDPATAFQEDHLHRIVQTIGIESRHDGFHLLNAYHVYGVKSDPGFHFDVMNVGGGPIGQILTDVLTGTPSQRADTHLNATPCDRLL